MSLGKKKVIILVIPLVAFMLHLIIGLFSFADYGVPWDEHINIWKGTTGLNYLYGVLNLYPDAQWNITAIERFHANLGKHYGLVFEMFTIAVASLFNVEDIASLYLLRHLLVFLCFFSACVAFYYFALEVFSCRTTAILCWFMLVASPRIFAHSFYNHKDIVFLSVYLVAGYLAWRALRTLSWPAMLLAGVFSGLAVAVRVMGVILPVVLFTLALSFFIHGKKGEGKQLVFAIALFGLSTFGSMFLFWPYLWETYWSGFMHAFSTFSHYAFFSGYFFGSYYDEIPWNYSIVWIFITTPFLVIVLACLGSLDTLCYVLKPRNWRAHFPVIRGKSLIYGLWMGPLIAVIVLQSTLYDAWRHLFYIYPFFILSAGYGYSTLRRFLLKNKQYGKKLACSMHAALLCYGLFFMVMPIMRLHPHQYVYFTELFSERMSIQFDLDCWGLSYRESFDYVLQDSAADVVKIFVGNEAGIHNRNIFPAKDRARMVFVETLDEADYFVSNFRWKREEYKAKVYPYDHADFELIVDGIVISMVRKLSPTDA